MSYAPGLYTQTDGQQRYWDGVQWTNYIAPAASPPPAQSVPQNVPTVKHRRNHAVAAIGFIIAAFLIGLGLLLPLGKFSGPAIDGGVLKAIDFSLTPSHEYALDESSAGIMLAVAITLAILGLLLLITRIRYLGLLWRILGLAAIALPAIFVLSQWSFINDPTASMKAQSGDDVAAKAIAALADGTRGTGWDLTAGLGLWLLSAGVVCAILAALIPAIRRQEVSYS